MPQSELRLIRQWAEFRPKEELKYVPAKRRGIYVLYRQRRRNGELKYDVVYVGMTTSGMHGRLHSHSTSKKKRDLWTHFSAFEAWENIRDDEIKELEGLLRHIYRKDHRANALNVQRGFKKLRRVRQNDLKSWRK